MSGRLHPQPERAHVRGELRLFRWCWESGRFLMVLRRAGVRCDAALAVKRRADLVSVWIPGIATGWPVEACGDPVLLARWRQDCAAGVVTPSFRPIGTCDTLAAGAEAKPHV